MKLLASFAAAVVILATAFSTTHAQLYWDTNGATPGATDTDPDAPGTWDSSTPNWSSDEPGTLPTAWVADSAAIFSAAGDAGGTFNVTISGTQSASGVTFEDGTVTLTGGQLDLTGAATVNVPSSFIVGRIDSVIGGSAGMNATGTGILDLAGASTYSGLTSVGLGMTVRLQASDVIPDGSVLTLASGNVNTAFRLNGFNETVRALSSTGATNVGTIHIGTNTLTINDQAGDENSYTGLYTTSAGGKIVKNGAGKQILNNFPGGFANGEFVMNSGIVGISQNNVFGTNANGSKLTINGGTFQNTGTGAAGQNWGVANVDINGSFTMDLFRAADTQVIGGTGATAGNTIITLGAVNPTITVVPHSSGTGTYIFAGRVLNGSGVDRGFTKAGAGVLILGNKNSDYRGATTIQEGVLRLRNQFFNATSTDNNGPGRIGDGTGAVNLAGGTLQFNGSPALNATFTAADGPRTMTVTNPINVTASSQINYFSTTVTLGATPNIDFIFTSDSVTGSGAGTKLTFRNEGSCTDNGGVCTFRPTFSGNFTFTAGVEVLNHTTTPTRGTVLTSTNTGTHTWAGVIEGTGGYRRTGTGATLLTGANTYAGGTTVDGGVLTVGTSAGTLGTGNVTVTGGTLSILSGVTNAIADTALLDISGTGIVSIGTGIDDTIAALSLGGMAQTNSGTYGSMASGADFQFDQWFTGMGVVTIPDLMEELDGDFNEDGKVDAADYVIWRKNEGTTNVLPNDNDIGGTVGADHFNLWRANFGNPMPGGGSTSGAVPEPASFALVLTALLLASGSRRRQS